MAKKKASKNNGYSSRTAEHHTTILLLAGAFFVVILLLTFNWDKLVSHTAYAPSSQVMQPLTESANMAGAGSPAPTNPDEVNVTITSNGFDPATVTVKVGAPVTFTNNDTTSHTATVYSGTLDTGIIPVGLSKTISFHTAGTYTYTDVYNSDWKGTIIVQ